MNLLLQPYGYKAMVAFLQARSDRENSEVYKKLLGELQHDQKGRVSEDVRDEWNNAVNEAMAGGAEPMTQLHLL